MIMVYILCGMLFCAWLYNKAPWTRDPLEEVDEDY
jgi:hypothetical protein